MTHKSTTDRRRVFKLSSKVGHVTRHAQRLFKVKRSKVKVTKSRDVSADKNATVHLQILLMGPCRQCGSWSVAGHSQKKVIGRDPICAR